MNELARRIAVTLGLLLVYRLGSHLIIPGIDAAIWRQVFEASEAGLLGNANAVSGGAIGRLSIFALGLVPYLTAAVLIQVASVVSAGLRAIPQSGEAGRRRIVRYTLVLTLLLATFQGFMIASSLQRIDSLVLNPGPLFVVTTTLTLAGGALLVSWVAEQITLRGIGNGIALILLTGIALEIPRAVVGGLQLNNLGVISPDLLLGLAVLTVIMVLAISFAEQVRILLPVQFAARNIGDRAVAAQSSALSFKLNNAGIIPAVVAPWFFYLPLAALALLFGAQQPWLRSIIQQMQAGQPAHMIFNAVVIGVLAFVYTASVIDPDRIAERLQASGGAVPGIAAGEATADLIDRSVTRATTVGAFYLALVYLIPELLVAYAKVPFYLGGASALIAVGAVLDIDAQVRALAAPSKLGD